MSIIKFAYDIMIVIIIIIICSSSSSSIIIIFLLHSFYHSHLIWWFFDVHLQVLFYKPICLPLYPRDECVQVKKQYSKKSCLHIGLNLFRIILLHLKLFKQIVYFVNFKKHHNFTDHKNK